MTRQDRPESGPSVIDKAKTLLRSQIRSRLTTRELVERFDSSSRRPRRDALSSTKRDSLIEAVTGPLRSGTYLEVGFGPKPYYLRTARQFSQQSPYLGIDGRGADGYKLDRAPMAIHAIDERRRLMQQGLPPNVGLEIGDGRHLDFLPDGSVQEIFMGDVMLSAGMKLEAMYDLFKEARRVLDPERGTLVVRESEVFEVNLGSREYPRIDRSSFGEVALALDLAGFQQRIILDENDGNAAETVAAQFGEDLLGRQFIIAQPKDFSVPERPAGNRTIWLGRGR